MNSNTKGNGKGSINVSINIVALARAVRRTPDVKIEDAPYININITIPLICNPEPQAVLDVMYDVTTPTINAVARAKESLYLVFIIFIIWSNV